MRLPSQRRRKKVLNMAAPVELSGRPAAPGIALGPLVRLHAGTPTTRQRPADEGETAALARAIDQARGDLALLETKADAADAAEILGFQIAMLEDEALAAPAFAAIARGESAERAWATALAEQIEEYSEAADDYFRARAADLRDIADRVLRHLTSAEGPAQTPAGAIFIGEDMTPSRFLETDWSQGGGLVLAAGSPTSHVAILARARGIPMVVGLEGIDIDGHVRAAVDGATGRVVLSPSQSEWVRLAQARANGAKHAAAGADPTEAAMTADGRRIGVKLNIADVRELDGLDPAICDGIGLVRTELLFHGDSLPGEDEQYEIYQRILAWSAGRPVTIRTLDAGGDKPIAGVTPVGESNPFLGLRGIRLSLARPELFAIQLRALARAAVHGDLQIMLPMVTVPEELETTRGLLTRLVAALSAEGVPCRIPKLGMMVEVPAAALAIERFDAAFFSIGSNDLIQYTTACARDIGAVAGLADPQHPAVLRLIGEVVRYGENCGREVSLCGDMAGDPRYIPTLLALGLDCLSMAPICVGPAKAAIAGARPT
jgi:phosphoenolpyruvate-protein phosphotransferase (PTS system enzyme I)